VAVVVDVKSVVVEVLAVFSTQLHKQLAYQHKQ
jgi:hypothetical protein